MSEMMQCAVYNGSPEIQVTQKPIPEVGSGDVLLKVMACGICGTDLRILNFGHHRIPAGISRVLGHELSGEVVEVGKDVSWPKVGMRVTVAPNIGCGHCDECVQGNVNLCEDYQGFGILLDGGFAEYMLVPHKGVEQGNISEIPDGLSYAEAAFTEPLSCAYHGIMACYPRPHDTVLIVGIGPIGLSHLQVARFLSAYKVIACDRHDSRLSMALEMGADYTVNPTKQDLKTAVMEMTNGRGVDIAIIAAPSADAQKQSLELLAPHGRINFFGGLSKDNSLAQLDANLIHYRELYVTGTTGQTVKQFRTTLEMMAAGHMKVDKLITDRFPLSESPAAFTFAKSKQGLKTMIFPHGVQ
ncbi:MAG TPA: zinc-dependent dehydrogenase [Longilinea sp.]|nr:zinc-dependent dehydrogenase [Longilinea sp.]